MFRAKCKYKVQDFGLISRFGLTVSSGDRYESSKQSWLRDKADPLFTSVGHLDGWSYTCLKYGADDVALMG